MLHVRVEVGAERGDEALARLARRIARRIAEGAVVAYPTESFYALGVEPRRPGAAARVQRIKGRGGDKPLLLIVDSVDRARSLIRYAPEGFDRLVEELWPGPLTLVLPAATGLPEQVVGSRGTVAVRWSPHPVAQALVTGCDAPLTGTSANRTGSAPIADPRELALRLGAEIDVLVDAGTAPGGPPSTLLDLTVTPPRILRLGPVGRSTLQEYLPAVGSRTSGV